MSNVRILSLAVAPLLFAVALADDKKADTSKLLGKYTIVSGKRDGKDLPKGDFDKSVVIIEKDTIYGHDKDKKEFFGATYTLDTSGKPWKISMVSRSPKKGEKAEGVIEADGDKVRLAYALPGGKAPTDFEAGEKQQSFVLKRMKKDK
jgi:uncharacterized protein (TIGR03067 family)